MAEVNSRWRIIENTVMILLVFIRDGQLFWLASQSALWFLGTSMPFELRGPPERKLEDWCWVCVLPGWFVTICPPTPWRPVPFYNQNFVCLSCMPSACRIFYLYNSNNMGRRKGVLNSLLGLCNLFYPHYMFETLMYVQGAVLPSILPVQRIDPKHLSAFPPAGCFSHQQFMLTPKFWSWIGGMVIWMGMVWMTGVRFPSGKECCLRHHVQTTLQHTQHPLIWFSD
jgi:hypothetical protein